MLNLKFDLDNRLGFFKPLNATNGGPVHKRHSKTQWRSNFEAYKEARMPYSRNHDSGTVSAYGGPYSHDIMNIFRDFDADANDPASYDFACTDESILTTLEAGTKTFFRLGQTIEHQIKKHHTLPPKNFKKWAVICEHIIRHYNEGWADGFNLNIEYWEIWNEPDIVADDAAEKKTWGGTKAQFFDFYEVAAKHLKKCFPNLKIGGPALAWNEEWGNDFLAEMKKRDVEIDFFSWHVYNPYPRRIMVKAERIRKMLVENGYEKAESILNEWNYLAGWTDKYIPSIEVIHSMQGAAFMMACMSCAQCSPDVDMLMYYDTRPSIFNGAFDFYTLRPLKGYYPLKWYGMFYDMVSEIRTENDDEDIYTLCGIDKSEKTLCVVTYYCAESTDKQKDVTVELKKGGKYEVYLLDEEHDGELVAKTSNLCFTMKPNSCILIKEI